MNLFDVLDVYMWEKESDDLFAMLQDYTLDSRINRDTMNRVILKELGSMRPISTDTTIMKFSIENFFSKYAYNISKLIDTMYLEYNVLDNTGVTTVHTESENRASSANIDNTDTYTTGQTESDTINETNEQQVSAYDSSDYQPKQKDTKTGTDNISKDTQHSGATTSDINSSVDTSKTFTDKVTGKDSIISYQSLIEQERKVGEFNIFNWIIDRMKRELFLLIY